MTSRTHSVFLALLALGAAALGGCASNLGASGVWVVGEMIQLTDRTAPIDDAQVFDAEARTIKLAAAANETVAFQLVIDAGPKGASGVSIKFSNLASPAGETIKSENIRAFRMWPIEVASYPAWHLRLTDTAPRKAGFYDPLSPVDAPKAGQPFDVTPNGRLAIWVDVHIPRTALPGNYAGQVTVTVGGGWTARIELEAHDFVLPDARPIASVGGFDHRTLFGAFISSDGKPFVPAYLDRKQPLVRRGLVIMRQLMRLAHDHRIDLFDREIHPVLKRDLFGEVRLDWEDYDAIVMPYLTGSAFDDRIGCSAWPVPFSHDWPDPADYGAESSEAYARAAFGALVDCRQHFAKTPELAGQLFVWPYRGPVGPEGYSRHVRLAQTARSAYDQAPILTQLPAKPPAFTRWQVPEDFQKYADIAAPAAEWLDPHASRPNGPAQPEATSRPDGAASPLAGVWLSPGMPPYLPDMGLTASPADLRALAWFAMKYNCTGLFVPEVLNWSDDPSGGDLFTARLFHPGTICGLEEVLPSVRLKRLRRGLLDAAYLQLLQQRGRAGIAKAITDAMVRYAGLAATGDNYLDPHLGGWVADVAAWRMASSLLAQEVQAAVRPEAASGDQLLSERLAWLEFDEKVHTIRLEQVATTVGPAEHLPASSQAGSDGGPLRATARLELYNEYGRDVDLLVKIDKLPAGWRAVEDRRQVALMPPGSWKTVQLAAEGADPPTGPDGKMPLAVSITTDTHKRQEITAQVPFLQAGRAATPPTIDGVLDDWPARPGNTAGRFRLVGRRGLQGEGLAERQTLAFVLRDDRNLYLAMRCQEPDLAGLVAKANNTIRYQQLMACDEDIVEVILDPGGAATSPQDLYHVAVKANGVAVVERGISSDPPLGAVRPWPAGLSVAIGKSEGVWVVEMSIPLEAFGQGAKQRFWGVNFMRFATHGAEASSWSGTPRYFYDPRNLGTMALPAAVEAQGK